MNAATPAVVADLQCPDCGAPMELVPTPAHWQSRNPWAYLCTRHPSCRGAAAAHPDGTPCGIPADAYTRRARRITHDLLDKLWQEAPALYDIRETEPDERTKAEARIRVAARRRTYRWLAAQLGLSAADCHIAKFDISMLRRAYRALLHITPADIRAWAKANPEKRQTK